MQPGSRLTSSTATSFFTGSFELEDETKTLEDYVVGQRLGEGAYGSVYVVKYIPSGDRFALKILQKQDLFTGSGIYSPLAPYNNGEGNTQPPPSDDSAAESGPLGRAAPTTPPQPSPMAVSLVKSFEQNIVSEAMVMQSLEHPHVVKFYKFLNSTTAFYFVLELAEGGELFDLILSKNYFAEDEARMYFQQLISAIDYCHRNGVAHKDLKAENLLLSNDGRLLVCDFGFSSKVAKENIDDPEETVGTGDNIALLDAIHNGSMFGTLHYSSPEAVLASSQQRDFEYLSADDGDMSTRYASALADSTFATRAGAYPSQADGMGSGATGRVCSSSSPVSPSSSDSPTSSRSGSTAQHRHRRTPNPAAAAPGAANEGGEGRPLHCTRSTHVSPLQPDATAVTGRKGAEESQATKTRDGRQRPTPLTPPPSASGTATMCHSSSTHSLSSLTNGNGKSHRKGSPTLTRNKVGEGISSFVKALLGSSGGSSSSTHHHHHHSSPHQHRSVKHSDVSGTAVSSKDKAAAQKASSPVVNNTSGKLKLATPRSSTNLAAEGAARPSETKPSQAAVPTSLRPGVSSQEPISVLSSAVSSTTTSPTTASFHTNPSFADSAGRVSAFAAASAATATRRGTLPPSGASPTTRVPQPASDTAGATRLRADGAAATAAALTTKSSAEELSGQTSSSHETGAAHEALPLPIDARASAAAAASTTTTSGGSPMYSSPVRRKPQPVIVDPFLQDLWSAGVILFFMLTGRLPFDGRDEEETLHLIQENEFAFDEDEVQRISPAARQLVTQMLAAEPTERPSTEQIIQNPWFRVGIQLRKDFPHREDLLETLASPLRGAVPPLSAEEHVVADGAIASPRTASVTRADGAVQGCAGNTASAGAAKSAAKASEQNGSLFRSGGGGGCLGSAAPARQNGISAAGDGVPITRVPATLLGSAASPVGESERFSNNNSGAGGSASSFRRDKMISSTFLDFSTQHPVSAEEERVLATAFRKVDSDGFGCITRDQLRDMLTTLHGDAVPTADVDELVRLFTGDAKADRITFQQFRDAWVSKDLAHTPFTHSSEFQLANIIGTEMDAVERQVVRQLRTAFDSLDETHSGVIQLDQVRRVFEKCHIPVQREDCLSLIKYFHDTELARCNAQATLNWHRWRMTPAATPTTTTNPAYTSGAASPLRSAAATPPFSVATTGTNTTTTTTTTTASGHSPVSAGDGAAVPLRGGPRAAGEPAGPPASTDATTTTRTTSTVAAGSFAGSFVDGPLLVASPAASPPPPESPMSPSSITVSFDSFVCGIVKSDILMKHPLGRKLAAATNLAAMFQSRNVTECVRHGFLVTGLQNVILAKLASMPERLLLLYSDEVVSNTENIYSFRYLGSSALVTGATMSSATPLLMSASLVAMAASSGPIGATSFGNPAQLTPGHRSASSASHRTSAAATPPSSSTRQHAPPSGMTRSLSQTTSNAALARTPSAAGDALGKGEGVFAGGQDATTDSNAGSLPHNPAPTVTDVNLVLFRGTKPTLAKLPSRNTLTRSDSFGSPGLPHDRCPHDPLASSGTSSQPPSQQQQPPPHAQQPRSAAVPIPRHPSYASTTVTAPTPYRPVPSASNNGAGHTPTHSHSIALSPSLAVSLSHSLRHSPPTHGARGASGALRDRHARSSDNDLDSVHDDTHSFFSDSRNSSSIVNTSEDTQSASDGALSAVYGEEHEGHASATVLGKRKKAAGDVAGAKAKRHSHSADSGGRDVEPATRRDSLTRPDGRTPKHKATKAMEANGLSGDVAKLLTVAPTTPEAEVSPSANSAASLRPSSSLSTSRQSNGAAGSASVPNGSTTVEADCSTAAFHPPQPSAAAFSSSLHSPPSTTHTNAMHPTMTPSSNFTHRAMAYGGTGAVAQVNGVCDVDVILSPACLGYTMVQFRRIHGKTSDFHEAVTFISNLLEIEREQAMEDTLTRGESELM